MDTKELRIKERIEFYQDEIENGSLSNEGIIACNEEIKKLSLELIVKRVNEKIDIKIGGEKNLDLLDDEIEYFFHETGIKIDPDEVHNALNDEDIIKRCTICDTKNDLTYFILAEKFCCSQCLNHIVFTFFNGSK